LPGIDFAGKTGTAQQMSHAALDKTAKGRSTYPNVWFVGVTPRRNPELVVAVLWQSGEFSYYPARIGAQVVEAYVNKQRRLLGDLPPDKPKSPVEMSAVWSQPGNAADTKSPQKISTGNFVVANGQAVREKAPEGKAVKPQALIAGAQPKQPLTASHNLPEAVARKQE
jgi:membrane peptidoglycan carboxypeptidase